MSYERKIQKDKSPYHESKKSYGTTSNVPPQIHDYYTSERMVLAKGWHGTDQKLILRLKEEQASRQLYIQEQESQKEKNTQELFILRVVCLSSLF